MQANCSKKSTGLNNSKRSNAAKKSKFKSLGSDESVTIMHALGRVFNPKCKKLKRKLEILRFWPETIFYFSLLRIDNDEADSKGVRLLQHSPEAIASTFTTQPSTNLSLMHSNYVGHFQSIDDVVNASDILSQTDIVLNEWRVSYSVIKFYCPRNVEKSFLFYSQSDLLPEVAMTMAVRGIMVTNEHPVTGRWMPVRSAKYNSKEWVSNEPLFFVLFSSSVIYCRNYDCTKECKTLGIESFTSSKTFALDYRHFGKIIQSKKTDWSMNQSFCISFYLLI